MGVKQFQLVHWTSTVQTAPQRPRLACKILLFSVLVLLQLGTPAKKVAHF